MLLQSGLLIRNPVCPVCPFHLEETCDGAEEAADILRFPNQNRPDCTDIRRQLAYFRDLARNRPEPVLDMPAIPDLPPFIPVLEGGLPAELSLPVGQLYGIGLRTVLSKAGKVKPSSADQLRSSLRLPPDARLCLVSSCDDRRIENFWRRWLELDSWRELANLGFEFVTGMTFSVWSDNPRFTQRYNIDRNFSSFDYFAGLGVPVVPIFFCTRDADFRCVSRWLRDRASVIAIGGLAQFHKSENAFARFLEGLDRIRQEAGRELHLFAIGCATQERISEVFHLFPAATIVTNKPIRKGASGHGFEDDLTSGGRPGAMRAEIIEQSLALFAKICEGYRSGSKLLDLAVDSERCSDQMDLFPERSSKLLGN